MPELPEVETTRLGIIPHLIDQSIQSVIIRQSKLRWPIPKNLELFLINYRLLNINRRAKYLIFEFESGHVLIHLGMSGSLRIVDNHHYPLKKHDHVDFIFNHNQILRFNDPRRFGAILWLGRSPYLHPLLNKLGPEPFSDGFNGKYLHQLSQGKKLTVKQFIMDQQVVTGVGNIYANESLYLSGISPTRSAGKISSKRYEILSQQIKYILKKAINRGGTTLRDFVGSDGKPGYFSQQLNVYGKSGHPCPKCSRVLVEKRIGNRSTVFCLNCQK